MIILALFFLFAGSLSRSVLGSGYDLYVDKNASSGGDGSPGDPFNEIEDALDDAKSGDKIYIKNGNYDGGFTIKNGVEIQGESESKVKIEGSITMGNGSKMEKITVSGGSIAVTVKKDARVTIDGCTVKDFSRIGINIVPGNGKLMVKKSNIAHSSGKGFYIERGNKIEISSSRIYDNDEEGIDIRSKVDGFIVGNEIYDNGESGIEVVLGSTDLSIKNNDIENNGASGITAQYYEIASKLGSVKIEGNEIEDNRRFGIRCGMPQKGNLPAGYWIKSLDVAKNEFEGNKQGRISSACKLVEIDQGDGGEEYDQDPSQNSKTKALDGASTGEEAEETEKIEEQTAETAELELKAETAELESKLEQIDGNLKTYQQQTGELLKKMNGRNSAWLWIRGTSEEDLQILAENKDAVVEEISQVDALMAEAGENPFKDKIKEKRALLEKDRNFLTEKLLFEQQRLSLWGLFKRISFWDRFL